MTETLESSNRCDKCYIAQAYVRVTKGAQVLDFCGHDYAKHAENLGIAGWNVAIDTRELLIRRPVGAEVS